MNYKAGEKIKYKHVEGKENVKYQKKLLCNILYTYISYLFPSTVSDFFF